MESGRRGETKYTESRSGHSSLGDYRTDPASVKTEPEQKGGEMSLTNYPIKKILAQHFQGVVSDSGNGFRTVPILLRAVADWLDENDVQDPEFNDLKLSVVWQRADAIIQLDDPFYYTATVYHLEAEPKELTTT